MATALMAAVSFSKQLRMQCMWVAAVSMADILRSSLCTCTPLPCGWLLG